MCGLEKGGTLGKLIIHKGLRRIFPDPGLTLTTRITVMKRFGIIVLVAVFAAFAAGNASALGEPKQVLIEAHVGIGLPTFDIADAAKVGPLGGVGFWYTPVDQKWALGAEADFGMHPGADIEVLGETTEGPDVNVYHFMGKAGYFVYNSPDGKARILLNAGAGAVMFDVDVAGADMETYLAINAGGKLYYAVSPAVDFVVSLQGDIAFSDKAALGTDNSWVWPLGVGIAVKF